MNINSALLEMPLVLYDKTASGRTGEGQCDCACSIATIPSGSARPMYPARAFLSEAFRITPSLQATKLEPDHFVCFGPYLRPCVVNQSTLSIIKSFADKDNLACILEALTEYWGEESVAVTLNSMLDSGITIYGTPSLNINERPQMLTAWLHITDRCNLRCDYCYLPHLHEDMNVETGLAVIDATFRSAQKHGYERVKLKYAGGEPLLRAGFITRLHQHAQANAMRLGLNLDGVVLSNGTLLNSNSVRDLKTLGLRLMVSLDGLDQNHDLHRHYSTGHGTFRDVKRGIDIACEHDLVPEICVTVSSSNASGLADLVTWILDRDLPFSLNFYRENHLSNTCGKMFSDMDYERIVPEMLAAYKIIESKMPMYSLANALVDRASFMVPHFYPCDASRDYLVFNSRGQLSTCQMQMEATVTNEWQADPILAVRSKQIGLQNLAVDMKHSCNECLWRYWCAGGCPLMTFRHTGRYDQKSPNCEIYQALFPEVVRLEGLRLLKYSFPIKQVGVSA